MFKPTYLYVKTHNLTGLKYFGKTTAKDPYKYKGSGVRWINHLKKHGDNISTEILGYYTNKEECLKFALTFSKENNIIKSKFWANLKEESLDGGFDYINSTPEILSKYTKERRKYTNNWKKGLARKKELMQTDEEYYKKVNNKISKSMKSYFKNHGHHWTGRNHTENTKEKQRKTFFNIKHQQGDKNSQYGTIWITNGIRPLKIKKGNDIPKGYRLGRK